jgi:NAD+ kinase
MTSHIHRVGIVAKYGLSAAAADLTRIGAWLRERQLDVVYETETARLTQSADMHQTRSREELPSCVDLIVVLGGDGTLLAMADRIAQAGRDIPILGVNFGGLGFLTELRIDELFPALESVVNGTATYDERLMLSATASLRNKDGRHACGPQRRRLHQRSVVADDRVVRLRQRTLRDAREG